MKKIILSFLMIIIYSGIYPQNGWIQKSNGPAKSRAGSFVIGGFGYYGAGNNTGGASETNTWFKYDPNNDTWTSISNMPSGMQALESFSINGKGYAGVGFASSNPQMAFYEYNPSTNSWSAKASYPSGANPPHDAGSFVINNQGYILGGAIAYSNTTQSVCNKYDPNINTWTAITSMPQSKRVANGNNVGSFGYAMGGENPSGTLATSCYKYDPTSNTWSALPAVTGYTGRYNSFVVGSNIYVLTQCYGTCSGGLTNNDFRVFNTQTSSWSQLPPRPFSGLVEATFVINGRVFVILSNGNVWEYTGCTTTTATITPQSSTTFCQGGSVLLQASSGSSYSWSTGATSQSITATQSNTYSVTVTDGNGCTATASRTVTVNPTPTAVINASGATTFCQGGSVSLTATGGGNYSWSNGSIIQSITVTQGNTYTVTVTDGNGCTATASRTVTVNSNPTVSFSLPTYTSINAPSFAMNGNPSGGSYTGAGVNGSNFNPSNAGLGLKNVSYTYTDGNGCIGVSSSNTIVFDTTGVLCTSYDTVTTNIFDTTNVTVYDTITTTQTIYDTVTTYLSVNDTLKINVNLTGIAPPQNTNTLTVYPNPTHDHLLIENGNLSSMNGYSIKITNTLGQIVFNQPVTQQSFYIDLSTWGGNGTYFLYVIDPNQTVKEIKKIVLQ